MEELVSAWVTYARQRDALLDNIVSLLRRTDDNLGHNENLRDLEMQNLKASYYRVTLAEKLRSVDEHKSLSPKELIDRAEHILWKRGHVATYAPAADMRSAEEDRMYGSLSATWSNLLKKAKVRAADNRGGPNRK
jgi:hypothetical protein